MLSTGEDDSLALKKKVTIEDVFGPDLHIHDPDAKWLSGESLQHALRIRAIHVSNPEAGLERLWQRLDRNYGSPEAIEASLFSRLESFPKVGHKDSHLLQELADLLQELEAAKDEGYLPGLSFLDTSRGINPIVEKLPGGLQEAWVKEGSRYKKDHKAHYPPLSTTTLK